MTTQTPISEREAFFIMSGATHLARIATASAWCEELHRAQVSSRDYTLAQFITDMGFTVSADLNDALWSQIENDSICVHCALLTELAHNMTVRVWGNCGAHRA
jgi:hypothetical protein